MRGQAGDGAGVGRPIRIPDGQIYGYLEACSDASTAIRATLKGRREYTYIGTAYD